MTLPQRPRLPRAEVPFPVEPQYLIRPDLKRLEPEGRRFVHDEQWPGYLARKLELLESCPGQCRVFDGEEGRITAGLWRVAGLLAAEHPQKCRLDGIVAAFPSLGFALSSSGELHEFGEPLDERLRGRILRHLATLAPVERLADALALAVQEDLVLMSGPPGGDSASLIHVCFPSHWNPADRAGASFAHLHAPVPHSERLLAGSPNLVAAMLRKGPFVRFVWSLTRTTHLDQNPARRREREEGRVSASFHTGAAAGRGRSLIESLYFRSERQTTTPLVDISLFTIRIYVAPLREVLDARRAAVMASAIRSMDDQLLRYKSLEDIGEPLVDELDELAAAG